LEHQVDNSDTDDDFILTPAPGHAAAMCAKCRRIRPIAEFKRTLTKAQSKARGYMGSVALVIESSMCRECQPRLKDVQHLTRQELHNRVSAGDLNPEVAQALVAKRKKAASTAQRTAAKRAWDSARTEPWATPLGDANAELTRLRQQEKYVKKTTALDLTFFVEYKLLLTATIARMKFEKMRSAKEPQFLDWQGFIDAPTYAKMFSLWESLPIEYRQRVKQPALFTLLPGDARPGPRINTLSTKPSPAVRLAQGKKD
jgi:hypothetical protein